MSQFVTDVASTRRARTTRDVGVRHECRAGMRRKPRATIALPRA